MIHTSSRRRVQVLHRIDVTINRRVEGKSGKAFVGEMQEEQALELAAKVASEGFVFAVSDHERCDTEAPGETHLACFKAGRF